MPFCTSSKPTKTRIQEKDLLQQPLGNKKELSLCAFTQIFKFVISFPIEQIIYIVLTPIPKVGCFIGYTIDFITYLHTQLIMIPLKVSTICVTK